MFLLIRYVVGNSLHTHSIVISKQRDLFENAKNSHYPVANCKMENALLKHSLARHWAVLYGGADSVLAMAEHCVFPPLLSVTQGIEFTHFHAVVRPYV